MPILFIHGVAVREPHDPDWQAVQQATRGVHWPEIERALREYVAPALNALRPQEVRIEPVYWGDLATRLHRPEQPPAHEDASLPDDLGEALEAHFMARMPLGRWPEVIGAVWNVARDENLRQTAATLPPEQAWPFLHAAVEGRLPGLHAVQAQSERHERHWHLPAPLQLQRRRNLKRALGTVRRPLESFVPFFLGDVLTYLNRRGTPAHPGPIPLRVVQALQEAHESRRHSGEPLVVLTHSMGGQLVFDALSAFLPARPEWQDVRVDFWCAAGSQVGLFAELNLFLADQATLDLGTCPHLRYFWNVWSFSDLLSFSAAGLVGGAHDTPFPLGAAVQGAHLAYLHHPAFYRTLAAKIRVHTSEQP